MQPMPPMPGPPPPPQGWPPPYGGGSPSTDGKAIASLVLGIVALVASCWLGVVVGVPAIALGALSYRDIGRSHGMTSGRGLAIAGMVLGSVASVVCVGWFGVIGYAIFSGSGASHPAASPPAFGPAITATAPATRAPPAGWGSIHVVELHPSAATSLRGQLADEVKAARLAGETVLVETVAPSCDACDEIARAMPDPALQGALERARLVQVDIDEFRVEPGALRMKEPELPWFYLVDAHGDPRDGISADEWDDNTAEQIAPVLDAFLRGKLATRRQAWGGGGISL